MRRFRAISVLIPLVLLTLAPTSVLAQDAQTAKAEVAEAPEQNEAEAESFAPCEDIAPSMGCIPGGEFLRGSDDGPHDVRPQATIVLDTFYMDKHEVTVAEYEACVATGGCKKAKTNYVDYSRPLQPKVGVSWFHAVQYCEAQGKHLPTEAEWEYASRGGLDGAKYPWGDEEPDSGGAWRTNIWQGAFPHANTLEDGFLTTAPVRTFSPNGYGLWQTVGNVWEWCADWWDPRTYAASPPRNPQGPERGDVRVLRGGSFLCHISYCNRYRNSARSQNTPDSSMGNAGFRTVAA